MNKELQRFKVFMITAILLLSAIGLIIDEYKEDSTNYKDYVDNTYVLSDSNVTISRVWDNYDYDRFDINYSLLGETNVSAYNYRNNDIDIPYLNYKEFYNKLYSQIYNHQKSEIGFILDSLNAIKKEHNLSTVDFAKVIVCMVQNIPYTLVLAKRKCSEMYSYYGPCEEGQRFGLFTPLEFLYNLKGDCDTRTLLLYTIFKELKYKPLILISNEYEHSILALAISSTGDHILHNGEAYYMWETTNIGWEPGILPPDINNKDYWEIALN